ncbi:MAG: 2TM domain-containing protein [Betaproteobacteria bacterium]
MAKSLTPEEIDRIARRRAGAKLGWYAHATVYLLVNATLFGASILGLGHRQWSVIPALGWGLGLVLHGLAVFVLGTGSSLRENLVEKERERLQRRQREP